MGDVGKASAYVGPRAIDEHWESDEDSAPPRRSSDSTGATSAPNADRQIITRVTSISSSAQPVNGTAPVTPVRRSVGVSTPPRGSETYRAP